MGHEVCADEAIGALSDRAIAISVTVTITITHGGVTITIPGQVAIPISSGHHRGPYGRRVAIAITVAGV